MERLWEIQLCLHTTHWKVRILTNTIITILLVLMAPGGEANEERRIFRHSRKVWFGSYGI